MTIGTLSKGPVSDIDLSIAGHYGYPDLFDDPETSIQALFELYSHGVELLQAKHPSAITGPMETHFDRIDGVRALATTAQLGHLLLQSSPEIF